MGDPSRVFIAVGSNIDPEHNIPDALVHLARHITLTGISTFYWTPPIGTADQAPYLDGVVSGITDTGPQALKLDVLCYIENLCGRTRTEDRFASRTIDLDILLHGDKCIREPHLTIPHPDIRQRLFVSIPLHELAPDIILPDTHEPLAGLVEDQTPEDMRPADAFTRALRERLNV